MEKDVGPGVDLLLADITPAAHMADDVLRPEDIFVDESEVTDARHHELKCDAGAAGSAPRHQDFDVSEGRDIEERLDTLESPVFHCASVLSGHSPVLRHFA